MTTRRKSTDHQFNLDYQNDYIKTYCLLPVSKAVPDPGEEAAPDGVCELRVVVTQLCCRKDK